MSSYNLNKSILLFHEMGTGKTGAAIATAERIRQENTSIKKCFVFAKSKQLLQNFKKELVTKYVNMNKKINKFYNFNTRDPNANKTKVMNTFITAFFKSISNPEKEELQ